MRHSWKNETPTWVFKRFNLNFRHIYNAHCPKIFVLFLCISPKFLLTRPPPPPTPAHYALLRYNLYHIALLCIFECVRISMNNKFTDWQNDTQLAHLDCVSYCMSMRDSARLCMTTRWPTKSTSFLDVNILNPEDH